MEPNVHSLPRRAGLLCLASASVLLLVATGVDPALGDADFAAAIAADPGAARLHSVLLHWSWVLFVPGLLSLLAPIRRRGRVLATVAWPITALGLATFAGLTLSDFFGLAVIDASDVATFERLEDHVGGFAWLAAGWQTPGFVGWLLSMLLVPLAAARAGLVGRWYPAGAIAGFLLYFLFAVESVPLSLTGPAVLTVTNVALAVRRWNDAPLPGEDGGFVAFRRAFGRWCLIGAPVALAVGFATMPGSAFALDDLSSHPALAEASAFFLHLGWLLFIPGVIEVAAVATGRGRRFRYVAVAVALLGLVHWNGLMIGDYASLGAEQLLTTAQVDEVNRVLESDTALVLGIQLPGMLGTLVGLILVPAAAARAGLVRRSAPVLAGLGVLAFFLLTIGRVPALAAPALWLVAYGLLARGMARRDVTGTGSPEAVEDGAVRA